jgi:hypothetical protein
VESEKKQTAKNTNMTGMNDQEETEVDIEEMIAQVAEAMAGGRQFDGWEEISAGRFVGTDMNRKPFGVMRVAAANAQSRCLAGDAREATGEKHGGVYGEDSGRLTFRHGDQYT